VNEKPEGYSNKVISFLKEKNITLFSEIEVILRNKSYRGILLPRPQYGNPDVLILKLGNGYNVGFHVDNITDLKLIRAYKPKPLVELKLPKISGDLPRILMLSTGGTIASRIDYQTGAVYPFFTAEEIYSMIPELEKIAYIEAKTVFSIFSEDMTPSYWRELAEAIAKHIQDDYDGIIIAHGTDTMAYTAAAMAFALQRLPFPIVFVGAQRSSDRPSSDTAFNVITSVITAVKAPFGESVIVMHGYTGDNYAFVHRGVKARKMHTSRRDAFQTINGLPIAKVYTDGKIILLIDNYLKKHSKDQFELHNGFDEKTALIKFYPGMRQDIIDFLIDKKYHGIVIEGTGLGHVANKLIKSIKRAVDEGIPVVITSQCLFGRVNLNVYRTGIKLLQAGVIAAEDMLPETAYVKLSWILSRTRELKEIKRLMLTNIAFEINNRSQANFFPNFVGDHHE